MIVVSWNGKFVEEKEIRISPYSRSFLYGENIFNTFLLRENQIVDLKAHVQRLNNNVKTLFGGKSIDQTKIMEDVKKLIVINKLSDAIIRISVFSNEEQRGLLHAKKYELNYLILIYPYPKKEKKVFSEGTSLGVVKSTRSGYSQLDESKVGAWYIPRIIYRNQAVQDGYDEMLLLSKEGFVAEATIANIFWIRKNVLYTPSKEVGLYPGITAREVMKIAKKLGLKVVSGKFKLAHLKKAEEIFLSASLLCVIPVTRLMQQQISGGKAGEITSLIAEKYWEKKKIKNPYL